MSSNQAIRQSWDLFCRVIDNWGDIGFGWRLARALATDPSRHIRLWVDDLATFAKLAPDLNPTLPQQTLGSITVFQWPQPWLEVPSAEVVISLFSCDLPPTYLETMARTPQSAIWIQLEYLSAEAWVDGHHGLSSRHPQHGLTQHFFFPGFTQATGGLLHEAELTTMRVAFQSNELAQHPFRQQLGLLGKRTAQRTYSLFCYNTPALDGWLNDLSQATQQTELLVCPGPGRRQVERWLGVPLTEGQPVRRGTLIIYALAQLSHDAYDQLLWLCDFNIVRGEDSFIRAQWAARPFLWHIYPQSEGSHLNKLHAFLDLWRPLLGNTDWQSWHDAHLAWLGKTEKMICMSDATVSAWSQAAVLWAHQQAQRPSLEEQLVQFVTQIRNAQP